ncbi:MAG: LPP20 family lipoprotein, partial [Candidatus Magnetomorum sp.]|nr:LPP20 family lipoprotein [Candidatus Magnetomorum sp.]
PCAILREGQSVVWGLGVGLRGSRHQKQIQQPAPASNPCQLTETGPRPSWIDTPPQNDQYLFGIGIAPKQNPLSNQIHAARILAMRDITQQINVHIKSLFQEQITHDHEDIQTRTELTAEALLNGVKIIDQWNDVAGCNIYMLASVALNFADDPPNKPSDTKASLQNDQNKMMSSIPKGLVSNVEADGSCVIQGISPRQAQTIALQRARALAIEKASGIDMRASRVVSDGMLVLDFIRSYSKGYIVREKIDWQPVRQFQKNSESPPLLEYHVSIHADIFLPEKKPDQTGLTATLNKSVFTVGERAILSIETREACQIAVFNIQANDTIVMLHPHPMRPIKTVIPNHPFKMDNLFPEPLPGEKHAVEALFICATVTDIDFQSLFPVDEAMIFSHFFKIYATIADDCTDMLIPYQVTAP